MTDKEKIQLADNVLSMLKETVIDKDIPVMIGHTVNRYGLNGFKVADVGTPVFEHNDRYVIYLESVDGKHVVKVPFYKTDLQVTFLTKNTYEKD